MISVSPNFFYTVTLPCTLWFLDKTKPISDRMDNVLFIDAREIYRQINRAQRDFTDEQIQFLANIVRLYRGEKFETHMRSDLMKRYFGETQTYKNMPGLCKIATLKDIEEENWSLNPGRYVGVANRDERAEDFRDRFESLNAELTRLNDEARKLEQLISHNASEVLKGVSDA